MFKTFRTSTRVILFSLLMGIAPQLLARQTEPLNTNGGANSSLVKRATRVSSSGLHLDLALTTGFASFQDIQVPQSASAEGHADGTPPSLENKTHYGMPFGINLVTSYRNKTVTPKLTLSALHASSMISPKDSPNASYARLEAGPGVDLAIRSLGSTKVGVEALYRRAMYGNSSGGHVVESIMPRGSLSYTSNAYATTLGLTGAAAVNASLKYDQQSLMKGQMIKGSKVSVFEWGLFSNIKLTKKTAIDLGYSQESTSVVIENVARYADLGLNISEFDQSPRKYNLNTSIFKLGYRRSF
jgi:hypothetical protein